ncbi:hypothetical protein pb186bvf_001082 [Paramecium bursaria]
MTSNICLLLVLIPTIFAWDNLVGYKVNDATQALYLRLQSKQGTHIISGQFDHYSDIQSITGKEPAIRGFDLQNYSPHNPWHDDWSSWDDGTIQTAINWYQSTNKHGIVQIQWHWFSPTGGNLKTSTFYTDQTNFDVTKAVIEGTEEHKATLRDIDAIAVQLKRLRDQGIPVLFRPLHEAGGKWFWWGAKGGKATISLYKILFNRINVNHGINNLIWVWSTPEEDYYPGKSYVDIVGYDSYPGAYNYDCNFNMYMHYQQLIGTTKLVALTENGPIPDIDSCFSSGARWNFFMGWSDLTTQQQNDQAHLKKSYSNSKTLNLYKI